MSTYETNERVGEDELRKTGGERITFNYSDTVHNCYQHRYNLDSSNTRLQAPILLEEKFSSKPW